MYGSASVFVLGVLCCDVLLLDRMYYVVVGCTRNSVCMSDILRLDSTMLSDSVLDCCSTVSVCMSDKQTVNGLQLATSTAEN